MSKPRALGRDAVRELDRRTIEEYGLPSLLLMENAGRAVADEVGRLLDGPNDTTLVLCGPGNNGGDGLVVARTLHNRGTRVEVVLVGARERFEAAAGDPGTNLALWTGLGEGCSSVAAAGDVPALEERLAASTVVVDALFGTGLTRPLRTPFLDVVHAVNACGRPVVAVDVPSGLDADRGEELGAAVHAQETVTFVAPKLGFERGDGPRLCGRVVLAEIGIPRGYLENVAR